jgi:hypothetical protein
MISEKQKKSRFKIRHDGLSRIALRSICERGIKLPPELKCQRYAGAVCEPKLGKRKFGILNRHSFARIFFFGKRKGGRKRANNSLLYLKYSVNVACRAPEIQVFTAKRAPI